MSLMNDISHLLAVADAYRNATGLKETTVSTNVFNDGKKLTALREGEADIGVKRLQTALCWFSAHWPDDAEWPKFVMRPTENCSA